MPKELTYARSTVQQRRAWARAMKRAAVMAARGNRSGAARLQAEALRALGKEV